MLMFFLANVGVMKNKQQTTERDTSTLWFRLDYSSSEYKSDVDFMKWTGWWWKPFNMKSGFQPQPLGVGVYTVRELVRSWRLTFRDEEEVCMWDPVDTGGDVKICLCASWGLFVEVLFLKNEIFARIKKGHKVRNGWLDGEKVL